MTRDPNLRPFVRARVGWSDSTYSRGWVAPNRKGEYPTLLMPSEVVTVGTVIANGDKGLTIASTIDEGRNVLNALTIPWGCIDLLEVLE